MVRVAITLDEQLLARVDAAAGERRMSRNAFLLALAERELRKEGAEPKDRMDTAIESLRGLADKYGTGEGSLTQSTREMRDSR